MAYEPFWIILAYAQPSIIHVNFVLSDLKLFPVKGCFHSAIQSLVLDCYYLAQLWKIVTNLSL